MNIIFWLISLFIVVFICGFLFGQRIGWQRGIQEAKRIYGVKREYPPKHFNCRCTVIPIKEE